MSPDAHEAIHAVRLKRLRKAVQALEDALSEGRSVSVELLRVSGLLERGIDPRQIRSTMGDLPRLIEVARAIESQHDNAQRHDARRVPSHIKV